jgi:hypothetical protein
MPRPTWVGGLPEVWSTGQRHQGELPAMRLGLDMAWAPSPASERCQRRADEPNVLIRNAVLGRWPVFVAPPGSDGLAHVQSVGLIGSSPHDGIWPSDHASLWADLAVTCR